MLPILRVLAVIPLVIAAGLRREERRTLHWFRARGAFDAERAVTFTPHGRVGRWVHRRLTAAGVLHSTGERYYLDDRGYAVFQRRRRMRALIVIALVVIAAGIAFLSTGDPSP